MSITLEVKVARSEVHIVARTPNPAGQPDRETVCRLSPAEALHLIVDIQAAAKSAGEYAESSRREEVIRLRAEIKAREGRLAELLAAEPINLHEAHARERQSRADGEAGLDKPADKREDR